MLTWKQLAQLPEKEFARQDLAATNLACAAGLPGSNMFDNTLCLQKINEATAKVYWQTLKNFRQFEKRPEEFYHSRAYFRMLVLVTVLQRDCGLRYNPAKIPEDVPFEAMDSFIANAILGEGGSCASMPVVYIAVGRRLGYPLKLVVAKGEIITIFSHGGKAKGRRSISKQPALV